MVAKEWDQIHDSREEKNARVTERRSVRTTGSNPPQFSKVMAIVDILVSVLWVPFLCHGAIMLAGGMQNPNLQPSPIPIVVWLLATGLMLVCGLAADIGMLTKKTWAVLPGWIAVCLVLVSIGANVFMFMGQRGTVDQMAVFGELAGSMLVRIGLWGAYIGALSMYSKWVAAREQ